ncbi:MAG: cytochrome b/b6 domain-containing protein, partial [Desulfobulbaceae bacterium]
MAEMVQKESGGAILNHWILAISCILLIITGFAFLFHLESVGSVFGGFETMKTVHNWTGVVFSVSLVLTLFQYLGDSLKYDADDAQ